MRDEINDDPVKIDFFESYRDVLGPIGARGMSESGELIDPPDLSPGESDRASDSIRREADVIGLDLQPGESRRQSMERRYDAGSVTVVAKWMSAVGASGMVLRLLSQADAYIKIWLKNRASRHVTIRKGDWEVIVKGDVDLKKIIEQLENSHTTARAHTRKMGKDAKGSA